MIEVPTIHIDMDKKCAECGVGGAIGNGLCMQCSMKATYDKPMKSAQGKAAHKNFKQIIAGSESPLNYLDLKGVQQAKKGKTMANRKHNVDGVVSAGPLKAFVARIEHVEEDQAHLADDKKVIYAEVKSAGYDVKIVRAAISRRKKDKQKLAEFEELLDLYMGAIGDLADTPLGRSAEPKSTFNA